jgi:hypothetical protein
VVVSSKSYLHFMQYSPRSGFKKPQRGQAFNKHLLWNLFMNAHETHTSGPSQAEPAYLA